MNDLDPQVPTPFTNKLWGCLLVNDRSVARYLVKIVKDAGRNDPDLSHICAQALCQITRMETSEETSQLMTEERKKQEEALHKFRTREANLLIAQVHPRTFPTPTHFDSRTILRTTLELFSLGRDRSIK